MAKLKLKKASERVKSSPGEFRNILVVDDEPEIHAMTRLVMRDWIFNDKGLNILSAESSTEAREILEEKGHDIALILLDVVMENDHSGLDLVKYIRDVQHNNLTRIVLRTGQPGKAPLRKVITDYEINDYKEKNELTADRLYVTVASALRSYEDLIRIDRNREGLEKVLNATSSLFGNFSLNDFRQGIMKQVAGTVKADENSLMVQYDSHCGSVSHSRILSGTGRFEEYAGQDLEALKSTAEYKLVKKCLEKKETFFEKESYAGYFPVTDTRENVLIFQGLGDTDAFRKKLIGIFSANASRAFSNLHMTREVEETQKEVISKIAQIVEFRSMETAGHIQRMTAMAQTVGSALNLPAGERVILGLAAPLHDVGKIGIPAEILQKAGPLNSEEFKTIETHSQLGFNILNGSERDLMKTAALIALDHHERWDGTGYPNNKKGDEISLPGRIIAIVDVFDALYNKRVYKEPWPLENIISFIKDERGQQFDPAVVDGFLEKIDEIVEIQLNNK